MNLLVKNDVAGQLLSDAINAINKQVALFEWEKTNKTGRYAKLFDSYDRDINNQLANLLATKKEFELLSKSLGFAEQVLFDPYDFKYFETLKSENFFKNWEMRYAGRQPTIPAPSDAASV